MFEAVKFEYVVVVADEDEGGVAAVMGAVGGVGIGDIGEVLCEKYV